MGPQKDQSESPGQERRGDEVQKNEVFEEHESGGSGKFYLALGIIALLVAVGSALYIIYKGSSSKKDTNKATVVSVTPTASGTATGSATASTTATTAATTSSTATGTSSFKYTDESIRIANGNGKNGEGARIKKILEDKGYKIASTGNASKNYDQTTVFYKTGQESLANALKEAIKDEYSAVIENSDTTVGSYDAIVVLGKQ